MHLLTSRPPECMAAVEDTDADASEHGAQICGSFGSFHLRNEFVSRVSHVLFLRQSKKDRLCEIITAVLDQAHVYNKIIR